MVSVVGASTPTSCTCWPWSSMCPVLYFFLPPPDPGLSELADSHRPVSELYATVLGHEWQMEPVDDRLHVEAHIGTVRLAKVDASVLNGLYALLLASGRRPSSRKGAGYSQAVLKRALALRPGFDGGSSGWFGSHGGVWPRRSPGG